MAPTKTTPPWKQTTTMAPSECGTAKKARPCPWQKKEKEAVPSMKETSDIVITLTQLLARRPVAKTGSTVEAPRLRNWYGSSALKPCCPYQSPVLCTFEAPPGLSLPSESEKTIEEPVPEVAALPAEAPVSTPPEVYMVLLRGLPDAMMHEPMVWAMLEQAQLQAGVMKLAFAPGGKVLITFSDVAWVRPCIARFNGRQWGRSVIQALYVKTMKKPDPVHKTMSVDAPAFVPTAFSVDAPAFVPASMLSAEVAVEEKSAKRDRILSDASTEAGEPNSDEASEESEVCESESKEWDDEEWPVLSSVRA